MSNLEAILLTVCTVNLIVSASTWITRFIEKGKKKSNTRTIDTHVGSDGYIYGWYRDSPGTIGAGRTMGEMLDDLNANQEILNDHKVDNATTKEAEGGQDI